MVNQWIEKLLKALPQKTQETFKPATKRDITHSINWEHTITDYLSSSHPGALVICGEWGSGKTHLFKNEISPLLKAKKNKVLYVSLYSYGIQEKSIDDLIIQAALGITDLSEASKQESKALFTETLSNFSMNAEGAGFIGALASSISGALKKRYIDSLKETVICFDDLDRIESKLILQAWAEINHFTEVKNRKVIILIDERKLPGGSIYSGDIEKNVWRKLSIHVTPELAIGRALEQLSRDLAEEIKPIIQSHLLPVTEHFKINNIRILSKALEALSRIKDCVDEVALEGDIDRNMTKEIYQKTFIAILVQHLAENREVMLDKICEGFSTNYRIFANLQAQNGSAPPIEKSADERLLDELPSFSSLEYTLPFIREYIKHGKLENEDIKKHIRLIHKKSVSVHPIYLAFEEFTERGKLSDDEYENLFQHCIKLLESPPPGDYSLRAYASLVIAVLDDTYNGATNLEYSEVIRRTLNGLDIVLEGIDTDKHRVENFELLAIGSSRETPKEVNEKIHLISKKVNDKKIIRDFYADINEWELEDDLQKLKKHMRSYNNPTLHLIGFESLQKFLCNASGEKISNFNLALLSRYQVSGSVHVIGQEVETLSRLLEFFKNNNAKGYRRAQFNIGIPILQNAIAHAENYIPNE
jgi:hypothetical protein